MGWLAFGGAVLALVGFGLLVLVDVPRRVARRLISALRPSNRAGHDPAK